MHKHTRLAFMVAPFLAVIGYIGADFYKETEAQSTKVIQLVPEGHCDVINKNCVLLSGEFKINVADEAGLTEINSTFPLDSATLFLVDNHNKMTPYPLGMKKSAYYWHSHTPLRRLISQEGEKYKLRLIVNIKGGQYISEFHSQTMH
jgi:hypothetical protein